MSSVPLSQAVSSGDASAVNALLANGANVNERTSGGQTPLILATIFGHTHLIPLLLKAGADPHLRDNLGLNAVDWAQRRGATGAIALFNTTKPAASTTDSQSELTKPQKSSVPSPHDYESHGTRPAEHDEARRDSAGEKSQRWLAGLKQRIAEQAQQDTPDGPNIFRARPKPPPAPALEDTEQPQTNAPEPQVEQIKPDAYPNIEVVPPRTVEKDSRPKGVRKRCPKCGTIYNSDVVSYCVYHTVELVDADEAPIISEPPRSSSPVLFWMIIITTLTVSVVAGSLATGFFYKANRATPQPATPPSTKVPVQKGTPTLDHDLDDKVLSLPIAECPLNGQEAIPGTVLVRIVINKDGHVTSARASGGDWLLRGAATEAAMKSRFSPQKLHGRETEGTITYTFEP